MAKAKEVPDTIANVDLATLAGWCVVYASDVAESQSATTRSTHPEDLNRWMAWLGRFERVEEFFNGDPVLDAPAHHPRPYHLEKWPDLKTVENPMAQHFVFALEMLWKEIVCSQSAEKASGIEGPDHHRWVAMLEKEKRYLDTIVRESVDTGGDLTEEGRGTDVPDINRQRPPAQG